MGLKMELIEKEKLRNTTFKRRKEGLIRKLKEFTTLCDVNACMIIYGPNQTRPEIWPPENPEQVKSIIDLYKSKNGAGIKTVNAQYFLKERQKQIEEELKKLQRKNLEAKYPTSDIINSSNEPQLRNLHAILTEKAKSVRSRIQLLKMKPQQHRSHIEMIKMKQQQQQQLHHNAAMMAAASSSKNPNFQYYLESAGGYYAPLPKFMSQQPYYMVHPQYFANQEEFMMRNQSGEGSQSQSGWRRGV